MDTILNHFSAYGMDLLPFLKSSAYLILGVLVICLIGRFLFRKIDLINESLSAVVGILFVYVVTVLVKQLIPELESFLAPLPYLGISGNTASLFSFAGADYLAVSGEILTMMILAFLVNLTDQFMPEGKKVISWLFFRILTVVVAMIAHLAVTGLLIWLLPEGITTYAPVILLAILALMLITGCLKFLVGIALSAVNPLIAALYTFFFANVVGKQITKSVLTTLILTGLVLGLTKSGITALNIAPEVLTAYLPFLIGLLVIWFVLYRVLNVKKHRHH